MLLEVCCRAGMRSMKRRLMCMWQPHSARLSALWSIADKESQRAAGSEAHAAGYAEYITLSAGG